MSIYILYHGELYHYGVKGMKWGVQKNRYTKRPIRGKIGLQFFAKRASSRKTVRLSQSEYSHIMHEVATWITEEQKNSSVFHKNIGQYTYMFDNTGDSPRVISKSKITNRADIAYKRRRKKR